MNIIAEHLIRQIPVDPPKRISAWAPPLAEQFNVSEKTIVGVIHSCEDMGWITKRGSQHPTQAHTIRLTQQGFAKRAQLLLNDRKVQDSCP